MNWFDVNVILPDADTTVLIACHGGDDPVWLGYLDGETWRDVCGLDLGEGDICVSHWAHMPLAPRELKSA